MTEIENILLEYLKAILAELKALINIQGYALRQEQKIVGVQVDIYRINAHIDLMEA